jgi:hypothetical protein
MSEPECADNGIEGAIGKGRCSASASRKSMPGYCRRASSIICGDKSIPTGRARRFAASAARAPGPVATSSRRVPASTPPGNVALDETGRNSPFTDALVRHVASSTDDLSALFIDVRNDVGRRPRTSRRRGSIRRLRDASTSISQRRPLLPRNCRPCEAAETWAAARSSGRDAGYNRSD